MIPSYFKIEILAIQDEFVLSGRKGLKQPLALIKNEFYVPCLNSFHLFQSLHLQWFRVVISSYLQRISTQYLVPLGVLYKINNNYFSI